MPNSFTLYNALNDQRRAASGIRTAHVFAVGAQTVDVQISGGGILRGLPISGNAEQGDAVFVQFDGEKYIARAGAPGRKLSTYIVSARPPCIAAKSTLAPVNPLATPMHIRAGECFDELAFDQGYLMFDTLNIKRGTVSLTTEYQIVLTTSVLGIDGASYSVNSRLFATIFDNFVAGDAISILVSVDNNEWYTLGLTVPQTFSTWSDHRRYDESKKLLPDQHAIFVKAKNQTAARGKLTLCHAIELSL